MDTTSHQRDHQVRRTILVEGVVNFMVLLAKAGVGFATGSLAILGDAIHSLTDLVNNVIAWFVLRVSEAPPDERHPYGHRKFETLAVFGLAAALVVLSFELALQALRRESVEIDTNPAALSLMFGVLLTNIGLALWQRHRARALNSGILAADASHTLSDVFTTVVVIVGWQLSAAGYVWLDTLCTLGVAGFVCWLAFGLFSQALPALVDEYAIDPVLLSETAASVAGVRSVSRARSRWMGSQRAVDLVLTVDSTLSTEAAHEIADQVEARLAADLEVQDISIHVEPHR